MKNESSDKTAMHFAQIPMQSVGPFKLIGEVDTDDLMVPMATYESPLWPSVARAPASLIMPAAFASPSSTSA